MGIHRLEPEPGQAGSTDRQRRDQAIDVAKLELRWGAWREGDCRRRQSTGCERPCALSVAPTLGACGAGRIRELTTIGNTNRSLGAVRRIGGRLCSGLLRGLLSLFRADLLPLALQAFGFALRKSETLSSRTRWAQAASHGGSWTRTACSR